MTVPEFHLCKFSSSYPVVTGRRSTHDSRGILSGRATRVFRGGAPQVRDHDIGQLLDEQVLRD